MVTKKSAILTCAVVVIVSIVITFVGTSLMMDHRWVRYNGQVLVNQKEYNQLMENAKYLELLDVLSERYYYGDNADHKALIEGAMHGAANMLGDPYTTYFSAEEAARYREQSEGTYSGIGVRVIYDDDLKVHRITGIFTRSPAADVGLQVGDCMIAAAEGPDGEWVTLIDVPYEAVVDAVSGAQDSLLRLRVMRGEEEVEFSLARDTVQIDQVEWRMLGETGLAYVRIEAFDGNAEVLFKNAITELLAQNAVGMVLDLRNNPGGRLDTVVNICDAMMGEGTVLCVRDRAGTEEKYGATGQHKLKIPYVVLVNESTASAGEVMACAASEIDHAPIIGTTTFGKGVGQDFKTFADGSMIKYTKFGWYSQSGRSIQGEGLAPNHVVELPEELMQKPYLLTEENDTQLQKAIEELTLLCTADALEAA